MMPPKVLNLRLFVTIVKASSTTQNQPLNTPVESKRRPCTLDIRIFALSSGFVPLYFRDRNLATPGKGVTVKIR
jgi:hypothetical protein